MGHCHSVRPQTRKDTKISYDCDQRGRQHLSAWLVLIAQRRPRPAGGTVHRIPSAVDSGLSVLAHRRCSWSSLRLSPPIYPFHTPFAGSVLPQYRLPASWSVYSPLSPLPRVDLTSRPMVRVPYLLLGSHPFPLRLCYRPSERGQRCSCKARPR
jgi:hypothetical protein